VNETACKLTLENARKLNLQDRLTVVNGDICSGKKSFDLHYPVIN